MLVRRCRAGFIRGGVLCCLLVDFGLEDQRHRADLVRSGGDNTGQAPGAKGRAD